MTLSQRMHVIWWRLTGCTQRSVAALFAEKWPDTPVASGNQIHGRDLIEKASWGLLK